jgi:alkyl hydroperoxide reductase subunit AhpC
MNTQAADRKIAALYEFLAPEDDLQVKCSFIINQKKQLKDYACKHGF